ncbi:unnamed protein product [Porites lobata]|uniref:Uncharacterized protein n=1 Tax=Porites lobata TaxID=104759 RepID=A0ABN8Q068_9CNID|nr:unnamed protein product [Porites lobata]
MKTLLLLVLVGCVLTVALAFPSRELLRTKIQDSEEFDKAESELLLGTKNVAGRIDEDDTDAEESDSDDKYGDAELDSKSENRLYDHGSEEDEQNDLYDDDNDDYDDDEEER